jgi:formiminoglutamase
MSQTSPWLFVTAHEAPLIVSMPHAGTDIPADLESRFVSLWLARKDADWWVDRLYDFAVAPSATMIRTSLSRSVIDVNRDPSGRSLYPGRNTTELCPTTTFDGEPLYRQGFAPDTEEIARRRRQYFDPYHAAIEAEIARLRECHRKIVLFEAHSIRSRIPRLFDGELPHFNIGTNTGASCAAELTRAIEVVCDSCSLSPREGERAGVRGFLTGGEPSKDSESAEQTPETEPNARKIFVRRAPSPQPSPPVPGERGNCFTRITDGRFKGGYTTRHYGDPARGVHAVQLELAMRGYMEEPDVPTPDNWPQPYDPARAAPLRAILERMFETCLSFARSS